MTAAALSAAAPTAAAEGVLVIEIPETFPDVTTVRYSLAADLGFFTRLDAAESAAETEMTRVLFDAAWRALSDTALSGWTVPQWIAAEKWDAGAIAERVDANLSPVTRLAESGVRVRRIVAESSTEGGDDQAVYVTGAHLVDSVIAAAIEAVRAG